MVPGSGLLPLAGQDTEGVELGGRLPALLDAGAKTAACAGRGVRPSCAWALSLWPAGPGCMRARNELKAAGGIPCRSQRGRSQPGGRGRWADAFRAAPRLLGHGRRNGSGSDWDSPPEGCELGQVLWRSADETDRTVPFSAFLEESMTTGVFDYCRGKVVIRFAGLLRSDLRPSKSKFQSHRFHNRG